MTSQERAEREERRDLKVERLCVAGDLGRATVLIAERMAEARVELAELEGASPSIDAFIHLELAN